MVQGIVIPVDTDERLREIDTSQPDAIANAVGGLMEAVDLHDLGVTLYVNEFGCCSIYRSTAAPHSSGGTTSHGFDGVPC